MPYAIGLALFLLQPVASLLVAVLVARGRVPWWADTPDDPYSTGERVDIGDGAGPVAAPYRGYYEQGVRRVHQLLGPRVADVYWLAWRNVLFGLRYRFKPAWLKQLRSYDGLTFSVERRLGADVLRLRELSEYRWTLGPLVLIWGSALTQIRKHDPKQPVRRVNMDGRPIFTVRTARTAP